MDKELQLFEERPREALSEGERSVLYVALQAVFSPKEEDRVAGLAEIGALDGHLRSPLVASALAHRLHEPNLKLLGHVVNLLVAILQGEHELNYQSATRSWASHALRQLGKRDVDNLLRLVGSDETYVEAAAAILNECSLSGEILVDVFTDGKRDLDHRLWAIGLIDRVGFMEAVPMIEHWIVRLTSRQERQLRMAFAPQPDPETEALLPALKQALISLKGGTLE
jgi:hypothetical protein